MQWVDFEEACARAGVAVDKHDTPCGFHRGITPDEADAIRVELPEPVADVVDGGLGLGWAAMDLYECVTGWNPVVYDDGYGDVLTLCNNGQPSVEDYGPDNLEADGYPLMGFYQLPVEGGETWRVWVVDDEVSRSYMERNAGNPDLVKLI